MKRWTLALMMGMVLPACAKQVGTGDGVLQDSEVPDVGWEAEIIGEHHEVGGMAVIVDEDTIEIEDWSYDGGGINSRLYLLIDGEDFHSDFELTDNLVGEPSNGAPLVVDLPAGVTFNDFNLITLWCVPAAVSFGAGVFRPPE